MVLKCDASILNMRDRAQLKKDLKELGVDAQESGNTVYCIVRGENNVECRCKHQDIVALFTQYPKYNITRHE